MCNAPRRARRLNNAILALDAAVAAACGWPANLEDAAILERLLALNLPRGGLKMQPETKKIDAAWLKWAGKTAIAGEELLNK